MHDETKRRESDLDCPEDQPDDLSEPGSSSSKTKCCQLCGQPAASTSSTSQLTPAEQQPPETQPDDAVAQGQVEDGIECVEDGADAVDTEGEARGPTPLVCCACGCALASGSRFCHACGGAVKTPAETFWLVCRSPGGGERGAAELKNGSIVAGSAPDCELPITDDDYVSRRHVRISRTDSHFTVEDLGSSNGTFVRVAGDVAVEPDDEILVGASALTIERRVV